MGIVLFNKKIYKNMIRNTYHILLEMRKTSLGVLSKFLPVVASSWQGSDLMSLVLGAACQTSQCTTLMLQSMLTLRFKFLSFFPRL
jgi:hypothetical protein